MPTWHGYGNITVPCLRSPDASSDGVSKLRSYNKFLIPYASWEPFICWLIALKWSKHGLKDQAAISKYCMRCTWTELALAFQIMTGFRIDRDLDLLSQEKIVKTMFKEISECAKSAIDGKRCSPAAAWSFGPSTSIKAVTGQLRLGMLRRPIIPDNILTQIINTIMDAQSRHTVHASFGIGFKTHIVCDRTCK